MASSLISGNGIKGTAGLLEAAAGTPGLLSGYQGAGSALKNRIAGSGIGQYFGSVFSSLGSFGSTLGNTKTGGFLSGLLGKAGGALGNLTMPHVICNLGVVGSNPTRSRASVLRRPFKAASSNRTYPACWVRRAAL